MEALVVDRTADAATITVKQPTNSFRRYIAQVALAGVVAALVIFGALFMADKMGAFNKTSINGATTTGTTAVREPGAKIGYTFGDPWNEIKTPTGQSIFTRCDPIRDGQRMFLTSDSAVSFQADALCKKS